MESIKYLFQQQNTLRQIFTSTNGTFTTKIEVALLYAISLTIHDSLFKEQFSRLSDGKINDEIFLTIYFYSFLCTA